MKRYALMITALPFVCLLIGYSAGVNLETVIIGEESWKPEAGLSERKLPAGYNLWKNTPKLEIPSWSSGEPSFQHEGNHLTRAKFEWPSATEVGIVYNQSDHPMQFLLQHADTKAFVYCRSVQQGYGQRVIIPRNCRVGSLWLYIGPEVAEAAENERKPKSAISAFLSALNIV
ncbi:uncharacterized protein PGTG_07400 [Puccinia graminis f. sp. tritici CRL 75-36-700-3]|uniref:Exosortase-associated EpsI family protein n=1 Tax=Puccinia graminis f. sp. tritici (strain CRL 75-36-700-3 / race SCCL) TaxID=418459 RepID=E3K9U0_PUCGT|nr:uncharacterized protein PGTG_07400 [Puccinia graminis f. sp. tritici CRL 75-36-700-3]EFP81148.2 hypothetical protein PGTG_07400 [Puccinia graminis f. sp. tritici CRL 75-36-700-3]